MGPRLVSRGNPSTHRQQPDGRTTSMGPRLVSRGNSKLGSQLGPNMVLLQWGRDSLVAEIIGKRDYRGHLASLQWGRDSLVAEISQLRPVL